MTPLALLRAVHAALPGSTLDGRRLYVGDQLVAVAFTCHVHVTAPVVFDGKVDRKGSGSDTWPKAHRDPVGRVLKAIQERQSARAASQPGPVPGPSREPEDCHAA